MTSKPPKNKARYNWWNIATHQKFRGNQIHLSLSLSLSRDFEIHTKFKLGTLWSDRAGLPDDRGSQYKWSLNLAHDKVYGKLGCWFVYVPISPVQSISKLFDPNGLSILASPLKRTEPSATDASVYIPKPARAHFASELVRRLPIWPRAPYKRLIKTFERWKTHVDTHMVGWLDLICNSDKCDRKVNKLNSRVKRCVANWVWNKNKKKNFDYKCFDQG